jgi:hypothetical protein
VTKATSKPGKHKPWTIEEDAQASATIGEAITAGQKPTDGVPVVEPTVYFSTPTSRTLPEPGPEADIDTLFYILL